MNPVNCSSNVLNRNDPLSASFLIFEEPAFLRNE